MNSPAVSGSFCDLTNSPPDAVWREILEEAREAAAQEPELGLWLSRTVLVAESLVDATARILAGRLATVDFDSEACRRLIGEVLEAKDAEGVRCDLLAIRERDPVAEGRLLKPFLFFKGFHALQTHRAAAAWYARGGKLVAAWLQSRSSEAFGVDIHPKARLGSGLLLDHATGIVIGETAVVDDDVSILHEVTLGGTGKQTGDRHPKVRRGVLLGAGSKILGNVVIGEGAKVGAGSVVLDDVPPHTTVAGVPAKVVARSAAAMPAFDMDQQFPHEFLGDGI